MRLSKEIVENLEKNIGKKTSKSSPVEDKSVEDKPVVDKKKSKKK